MQRRTLIVAGAVAGALIAVTAIVLADPDVRAQALASVSPVRFRDGGFVRFVGTSGEEVYVLGHAQGRRPSDDALTRLRAAITRLRPDVVLVEANPEDVARDNLGAAPVEALYATLAARQAGAAALGFDWGGVVDDAGDDDREDLLFAGAEAAFAGHRKVLIVVGLAHLRPFSERLRALGFRRGAFAAADRAALFDLAGVDPRFPAGMAAQLRRRVDADRAALKSATDASTADRLRQAIAARQALLKTVASVGEA